MFSLVTTVFNGQEYIEEYFKGLSQLNKDYVEVIIVDDGSNDSSQEMIINKKYDFVTFYQNPSKGRANALNYGIENSRHEWIIILDIDDFICPNYVEGLKQSIAKTNFEKSLFFSNAIVTETHSSNNLLNCEGHLTTSPKPFNASKLFFRNSITHSGVCFKKNNLHDYYDESLSMCVDLDLYFSLREQGYHFYHVDYPGVVHYHNTSSTFKKNVRQYPQTLSKIYSKYANSSFDKLMASFSIAKTRLKSLYREFKD